MAKSKTTTNKRTDEQPVESVTASQQQQQAKHKPMPAVRRVPVQYTPRIPSARCPWC